MEASRRYRPWFRRIDTTGPNLQLLQSSRNVLRDFHGRRMGIRKIAIPSAGNAASGAPAAAAIEAQIFCLPTFHNPHRMQEGWTRTSLSVNGLIGLCGLSTLKEAVSRGTAQRDLLPHRSMGWNKGGGLPAGTSK
jgi:hypothetical protein